jgi:glutathione S-transferase
VLVPRYFIQSQEYLRVTDTVTCRFAFSDQVLQKHPFFGGERYPVFDIWFKHRFPLCF